MDQRQGPICTVHPIRRCWPLGGRDCAGGLSRPPLAAMGCDLVRIPPCGASTALRGGRAREWVSWPFAQGRGPPRALSRRTPPRHAVDGRVGSHRPGHPRCGGLLSAVRQALPRDAQTAVEGAEGVEGDDDLVVLASVAGLVDRTPRGALGRCLWPCFLPVKLVLGAVKRVLLTWGF